MTVTVAIAIALAALDAEQRTQCVTPAVEQAVLQVGQSQPGPEPGTGSPDAGHHRPAPVLLYFTAAWCGPCKTMRPIIEKIKAEGYDVRIIDIDKWPRLKEAWGVGVTPTVIAVVRWREIERIEGVAAEERIRKLGNADASGN